MQQSQDPAIQEVAVAGFPHERWGEAARAFVVLKSGQTATEEELRDFLFIHPAELYTSTNRDFFKGTAVEKAVDNLLADKK